MTMTEWAENEVKLACKREAPDRKEGEWDYGCACYESALKAYKSLMEDEHSGFSFGMTKQILLRLCDGRPLTPIEDIEDEWIKCEWRMSDKYETYRAKRMSSLFKNVYPDGTVDISDSERFTCFDVNNPYSSYTNGLVSRIMNEMFPIKFPYSGESFKVYTEDLLTDPKHGDFDTIGIYYAILPNGDKNEINRFFKEAGNGWEEINVSEYNERYIMNDELREKGDRYFG